MKTFIFLITVMPVLFLASCRSSFNRLEYLTEYQNLAIYRIKAEKFPSNSELKKQIPAIKEFPQLTAEQIISVLGNFEYVKNSFWGNIGGRVFYDEELKYMAPYISQHLQYLKDEYRLVIVSRFDPDKSVLSRMERVSAVLWLDEEGLNVVFGEIKTEIPRNDYYTDDESWKDVYPVNLRRSFYDLSLVKADFFERKLINGRYHETWAVIPEKNLMSLKYNSPEAAPSDVTSGSDISGKLKSLKKAKDEDLITEEEYQQKRKEILKSF